MARIPCHPVEDARSLPDVGGPRSSHLPPLPFFQQCSPAMEDGCLLSLPLRLLRIFQVSSFIPRVWLHQRLPPRPVSGMMFACLFQQTSGVEVRGNKQVTPMVSCLFCGLPVWVLDCHPVGAEHTIWAQTIHLRSTSFRLLEEPVPHHFLHSLCLSGGLPVCCTRDAGWRERARGDVRVTSQQKHWVLTYKFSRKERIAGKPKKT